MQCLGCLRTQNYNYLPQQPWTSPSGLVQPVSRFSPPKGRWLAEIHAQSPHACQRGRCFMDFVAWEEATGKTRRGTGFRLGRGGQGASCFFILLWTPTEIKSESILSGHCKCILVKHILCNSLLPWFIAFKYLGMLCWHLFTGIPCFIVPHSIALHRYYIFFKQLKACGLSDDG